MDPAPGPPRWPGLNFIEFDVSVRLPVEGFFLSEDGPGTFGREIFGFILVGAFTLDAVMGGGRDIVMFKQAGTLF